jgi:hypothetical protein
LIRLLAASCLLAGCAATPAFRRAGQEATAPAGASAADFARAAGAVANRRAGSVLSANPPLVRLDSPGREQPEGIALVARDARLRPAALLRAGARRGTVLWVRVERGALRPGLEVVEPSPALAEEAARLPAAR